MEKSNEINYGNWISSKMLKLMFLMNLILVSLCCFIFSLNTSNWDIRINYVMRIVIFTLTILMMFLMVYMFVCRNLFSYKGKYKIQSKIIDYVISYLNFKGGKILDIGCGNGALSIRIAKKFITANLTSIDYWGSEWEFAKEQCELNAKAEGVENKITFKKGDAAKLDFKDESFDAVVSNFVFHEVKSQKDKRLVVREALRVLKKDGTFVFHDLFLEEKLYGNIYKFISELKKEGIKEIHLVYSNKEEFIPDILKTRFMLGRIAIIYGVK